MDDEHNTIYKIFICNADISGFLCNLVMSTQDVKIPVVQRMDDKTWMSNTIYKIYANAGCQNTSCAT